MQLGTQRPDADRVFRFFSEISAIPRASGVTAPIADYLCDFARARGLFFLRDESDNLIIKKAASKGFEGRGAVILQAHTDMVLVQSDPTLKRAPDEGVKLCRRGDLLCADGTSLGGDDGIGMAYILAVLDDDTLTHPPIEGVFTSNEEIGLLGAAALDCSALSGRMLINLDSDTEGVFTAGCAGGSTLTLTLPFKARTSRRCFKLSLKDLPGGHSGVEITKGYANAILLLLSLLDALSEKAEVRLASLEGGEASNAIPSFASVKVFCSLDFAKISEFCKYFLAHQRLNIGNCAFSLEECGETNCLGAEESHQFIREVLDLPSGVLAMEPRLQTMPRTSLNLGRIVTDGETATLIFSLRSSSDEERRALEEQLARTAEALLGSALVEGEYPAWEYRESSPLRELCLAAYRKGYGKEAVVEVTHAGLECGILAAKLAGLDAVSLGPTNRDIHTPLEALSITSSVRTYYLLTEVLSGLTAL